MSTPDPTAVRKDAEHTLERHNCPYALRVCRAYLALTDPTPLTVEVLVGMGGVKNGEHVIDFAGFNAFHGGAPETWLWGKRISGESLMLPPRTAGELWQLLMRLEK